MKILQVIKQFFGFFNLTDFEHFLFSELKKNLKSYQCEVLNSQLKKFNKVDRVLTPKTDLDFGHTSFYWTKFGRARFDFPKKFKPYRDEAILANMDIKVEGSAQKIYVSFVIVKGFLFSIEYRTAGEAFVPSSNYRITNVDINELYK